MNLTSGYQAAQNFANLAARRQWGKEQLNLFHAGRNHCLQVDRGQYRDGRDLRCGGAFRNGLLESCPKQLPLSRLADGGNNGNDAKLLPKLGNGAQNSAFSYFPSQRVGECAKVGLAGLQLLVSLHGQLRNLARTCQLRAATPVAVASQGIHIGQNPARNHIVRLLSGVAQQIQPYGYSVGFKTHQ